MRAAALENGLISAAPFSPEDAVRLTSKGYPLIVNLSEALPIPETIIVARSELLGKYPETAKRFLKALVLGIHFAKTNKSEAIKAGYEAGLKGEPDIINKAYDFYAPGFTPDQRFFVGYAQWACENQRPENLRVSAVTNPHSPGKYRINGVVINMPEFQNAFFCKAGQPMVRENRCRVW